MLNKIFLAWNRPVVAFFRQVTFESLQCDAPGRYSDYKWHRVVTEAVDDNGALGRLAGASTERALAVTATYRKQHNANDLLPTD